MSLSEANQKYFDAISDSYDSKPWFAKVNQQVTDFLRSRLDWVGIPLASPESTDQTVRLLDYACGPGLMSKVYGPYVTVTRGIDVSSKMVSTYNDRARAAGFPEEKIVAVQGDIFVKDGPTSPELAKPEFYNFDLAIVGFGFHHFEDVVHASRCLKERLRPGGVLLISDFLEGGDLMAHEDGNPIAGSEGDHVGHIHHGHHEENHVEGHDHHGHDHSHNHHGHHHDHGHSKESDDHDPGFKHLSKMNASIVVPSFTLAGVTQFFTEAGFVDVDVITMKEKVYMQFAGKKVWRTILFARGRRPLETEETAKSEL
ncbi:S-adenosyl-L-methionine-dependent methyltransferase [Clohesyomyces aquaticus]|uniref:S-adenosyl-L-methionine-dependent methyltransferase n=1 Tax=Clohesyomyces aquaticus TaxID=1231657 RepID=A0A1Y1ZPW6_9PLEO|nr:S-adenosyl-L-methionine-dependent methyltransferase [Clohesyomyces aquaticus]